MSPSTASLDQRIMSLAAAIDPDVRAELRMALVTLRQAENIPGAIVTAARLLEGQSGLLGRIAASSSRTLNGHLLVNQIEELLQQGILPSDIASDAHWVRVRSNLARHRDGRGALRLEDAEMAIRCALRVAEWYYCEYDRGPRLPGIDTCATPDAPGEPNALPAGPFPPRAWPPPFGDIGPQLHLYFRELDRLVQESNVENFYVPLNAEADNGHVLPLDEYAEAWLGDDSKRHLAILGDSGTGKSWFCLRLAKQLGDRFRADPVHAPVPLFISFRRHGTADDLVTMVQAELLDAYNVDLPNRAAVSRLLRSGHVVLILDGMDEMAKQQSDHSPLLAFHRLGLPVGGPKVIVTCRTHYFQSGSEQREVINPDAKLLSMDRVAAFDVIRLRMFDRPALVSYVERRIDESARARVLDFIDTTYNLAELCARPVLLSLVCDSHALLSDRPRPVTSAVLYEEYVRAWLRRELMSGRLRLHPDAVTTVVEDLAYHMLTADTLVLEPGELRPVLAATLDRLGLGIERWPDLHRQLITSAFIKRSEGDDWEFAHRSFQEFFYARKFFRWEQETGGQGEFPVTHIPVWHFIAELALERWTEAKAVHWISPRIDRQEDPSLTLTTLRAAAAYWLLKRGSRPPNTFPLAGVMLDSVDLRGVNLAACDLADADFHRADLRGADLSCASLPRSAFFLAALEGASLRRADAQWADFRRAILVNADLRGARMQNAQLDRANLAGAHLSGVEWRGVSIAGADFRGADFGVPGSDAWVKGLAQLKECSGLETALFDAAVSATLRSQQ